MLRRLQFYLRSRTRSPWHYVAGETLQALLAWVPGLPGVAARGLAYKSFLTAGGLPAIEDHVRLIRPEDIALGERVFLDHGVYLHAGQGASCSTTIVG